MIETGTNETIRCDQAVFTSIRSPMGQGYRVVAASGEIRPDEKAEITARSPSHASLCESDTEPIGLSSYRLASGRRCVGHPLRGGAHRCGFDVIGKFKLDFVRFNELELHFLGKPTHIMVRFYCCRRAEGRNALDAVGV